MHNIDFIQDERNPKRFSDHLEINWNLVQNINAHH